jgi:hypothetical protein
MNSVLAFLGLLGPASIIIALVVIAQLSQRLGAVTKRPPIYRWLYVSVALVAVCIIERLIALFVPNSFSTPLLYDLPFAAALVIAVFIAWRYWSWLLSERGKGHVQ